MKPSDIAAAFGTMPLGGADCRLACGLEDMDHTAWSTAPVLITDPNTSRRRGLARLIHDHGWHQHGPFVAWSCQIAETRNGRACRDLRLVLELARGGSVFLDAIDRMSHEVQAELFAFLTDESRQQSAAGDECSDRLVRVIAGTDSPLLPSIKTGAFDEALFYRLNVIHVVASDGEEFGYEISAVRERKVIPEPDQGHAEMTYRYTRSERHG